MKANTLYFRQYVLNNNLFMQELYDCVQNFPNAPHIISFTYTNNVNCLLTITSRLAVLKLFGMRSKLALEGKL